jgi:lactate dehydrogenase-like 2-hydroxyacid dehydrogenase
LRFVNDVVDAAIEKLAENGVKIALRCAGFNNVDLIAAKKAGIRVCRVPFILLRLLLSMPWPMIDFKS